MATKKTKETVETKELAVSAEDAKALAALPTSWGDEGVEGRDILIGKALLMQGQSDFVQDGKAVVGEICNSLTEEKLHAKGGAPFKFIPFFSQKVWVILKKPKGSDDKVRWEFIDQFPYNAQNADLEWLSEEGDDMIRRDLCMNYYGLNADNIDDLPLLISFRRTSTHAGRNMASFVTQLKSIGKPMASRVFELYSEQKEKDGSKFSVFKTRMTKDMTNPAQMLKAFEWYKTVKLGLESGAVGVVDEHEDAAPSDGPAPSTAKGKPSDAKADNIEY